jgi:DNA excision repair protein ERCC-4
MEVAMPEFNIDDLLADDPVEVEVFEDFDAEPVDAIDVKKVCPFSVVVDTREQAPWHFLNVDPWKIVPLITDKALATGDYSIAGAESRIAIERKSIQDLLGSITAGRDRFEREFERLAKLEHAAVVVEGDWTAVLEALRSTKINADSLCGTVASWSIRYGVYWWFCFSRRHAEIWTLQLLHQWWKQEQGRLKEVAKATVTAK